MRRFLALLFILSVCADLYGAQSAPYRPFEDDVILLEKRHDIIPVWEIVISNGMLGAANYYIGDRTWAQIGTATIIDNFEQGFDWDPDGFPCNMLDHPYHGAMFQMYGRSSGHDFLLSALYSAVGSFQWEFFMETERPSTNDMIMTTFAGNFFGEMLFRISAGVAAGGNGSFLREAAAFLISPPLSLNRWLYGPEMSLKVSERPILKGSVSAGRTFSWVSGGSGPQSATTVSFSAEYDNTAQNSRSIPYEYFDISLQGAFLEDGTGLKALSSRGILYGKKKKRGQELLSYGGLYGTYDFREDFEYDKLSAVGVGPGVMIRRGNMEFFGSVFGVFGGASARHAVKYGDNPYIFKGETYNFGSELKNGGYYMGPGISTKLEASFRAGNLRLRGGIYQLWIHSLNATDANEWGFILPVSATFRLSDYFAELSYERIRRVSFYDDLPMLTGNRDRFTVSAGISF